MGEEARGRPLSGGVTSASTCLPQGLDSPTCETRHSRVGTDLFEHPRRDRTLLRGPWTPPPRLRTPPQHQGPLFFCLNQMSWVQVDPPLNPDLLAGPPLL